MLFEILGVIGFDLKCRGKGSMSVGNPPLRGYKNTKANTFAVRPAMPQPMLFAGAGFIGH
jgi:hypothetical protein